MAEVQPLMHHYGVTAPDHIRSDDMARAIDAKRKERGYPPHNAEEYLMNTINNAKGVEERAEKEVKKLEMEVKLKDDRIKELKKQDDYDPQEGKAIEREIERLRKDIMKIKSDAAEAPQKALEAKEKLKTLRQWYKENPVPPELQYPPTGKVPGPQQLDPSQWST